MLNNNTRQWLDHGHRSLVEFSQLGNEYEMKESKKSPEDIRFMYFAFLNNVNIHNLYNIGLCNYHSCGVPYKDKGKIQVIFFSGWFNSI